MRLNAARWLLCSAVIMVSLLGQAAQKEDLSVKNLSLRDWALKQPEVQAWLTDYNVSPEADIYRSVAKYYADVYVYLYGPKLQDDAADAAFRAEWRQRIVNSAFEVSSAIPLRAKLGGRRAELKRILSIPFAKASDAQSTEQAILAVAEIFMGLPSPLPPWMTQVDALAIRLSLFAIIPATILALTQTDLLHTSMAAGVGIVLGVANILYERDKALTTVAVCGRIWNKAAGLLPAKWYVSEAPSGASELR